MRNYFAFPEIFCYLCTPFPAGAQYWYHFCPFGKEYDFSSVRVIRVFDHCHGELKIAKNKTAFVVSYFYAPTHDFQNRCKGNTKFPHLQISLNNMQFFLKNRK